MAHMFGEAKDFFRLRLIRLDAQGDLDLEWRDDILWRRPAIDVPEDVAVYRIEAVRLDDEEDVTVLADFDDYDEALAWLEQAQMDLDEMTAAEFEEVYVEPSHEGE
ncbi:MAG: hypothetical protein H5T75_04905 [Coriobacteriia bacterium]|nr:hypothetical protein [Coriobacteriia bacterium]